MSSNIIGAGFGHTGTTCIKAAREQLGFGKYYHLIEMLTHPLHVSFWSAALNGQPVEWQTVFGD